MRILISGASIAGPVLAYWLHHFGFEVTVVERAPRLRKTGGHAVDLFRPAMDISEKMGVLPAIEAKITGMDRIYLHRPGRRRPVVADLAKVFTATSDRHVEIMRDDLSEIYYDVTRADVEYVFGDSVTSIGADGTVTFEHGEPRRFDLVVGADGLHSNVRRLVFGDEAGYSTFVGAYLAVASVPKEVGVPGKAIMYNAPGRGVGVYGGPRTEDGRLVFLFRAPRPLDYHHRDVERQKDLLRERFAGMDPQVDRWLTELDRTPAFYFDSITQLRMGTWSRGRVTLVGDAGYCPGPAVGGSTSLAVIGAYVLAGELAAAGGDHERAFPAYEREMAAIVRDSRAFALGAARFLIPRTRLGVWSLMQAARLVSLLPARLSRALAKLNDKGVRLHDSMVVKDYGSVLVTEGER
ncbi:MAG TPA: FAD-dependent monooxygenase [Actinophytocola sp.]|jgi:2-polyprenyl-6-methoxyphenol hydroxylase-like FAD-dependent oxidoreductase|uniref:FAD-dependent monooxygenase n=1 Tax=Actinophytocola sp. TaxID=1872138 RepID=UPI002F928092